MPEKIIPRLIFHSDPPLNTNFLSLVDMMSTAPGDTNKSTSGGGRHIIKRVEVQFNDGPLPGGGFLSNF